MILRRMGNGLFDPIMQQKRGEIKADESFLFLFYTADVFKEKKLKEADHQPLNLFWVIHVIRRSLVYT